MKKFKHLYKQIIENYTEGGSIFNGFSDMMPRTSYSDFGVHRIGEGDSVSRLNAFIHKFLGGTYIDPNGAIKELKSRLNMVGLDFDFDGSKVKLNPGQNVFPVKLYGDVFGQTPTTDLSKGFDHGDDLPMLKLMINCNYDEETCMWSMNGKLGIIREKNNSKLNEDQINEVLLGKFAGNILSTAAGAVRKYFKGGSLSGSSSVATGGTSSGASRVGTGGWMPSAQQRAIGALYKSKPGATPGPIDVRTGGFGMQTPQFPLREQQINEFVGAIVGGLARRAGGAALSRFGGTVGKQIASAALQPAAAARAQSSLLMKTGTASLRDPRTIGYLFNPASAFSLTKPTVRTALAQHAGYKAGQAVAKTNKFVKNNPITSLMAYDYLFRGQNEVPAGGGGGGGGGDGGYVPGRAAAMSFGDFASPTTLGGYSTVNSGMRESANKEDLFEKSKIYKKIKDKMCEYGCKSKDEMGEYGYDSEEGEEGPLSSPSPPQEHVVGYMDQMGGPISESVTKDKARSVMHAINRKGELREKVLLPVFNNLLSKKLKGKLGTDDIRKQLFYVVNSAARKLKLVLSDKEKTRVVNDLIRNFRSFSKKKHSTPHQKGKQIKKSK